MFASSKVTIFSAFSALAAGYSVAWGYIETRKFMKNWLKKQEDNDGNNGGGPRDPPNGGNGGSGDDESGPEDWNLFRRFIF